MYRSSLLAFDKGVKEDVDDNLINCRENQTIKKQIDHNGIIYFKKIQKVETMPGRRKFYTVIQSIKQLSNRIEILCKEKTHISNEFENIRNQHPFYEKLVNLIFLHKPVFYEKSFLSEDLRICRKNTNQNRDSNHDPTVAKITNLSIISETRISLKQVLKQTNTLKRF